MATTPKDPSRNALFKEIINKANATQLAIALVGTFAGVFSASWLERAQQEAAALESSKAVLGAALTDCTQSQAAAADLFSDWDGTSLPPQQLPTSTWAALIINGEVLTAIDPADQEKIAQSVFQSQRSLSQYNRLAEEFRVALGSRPTILPPPGAVLEFEIPPQLQRLKDESDLALQKSAQTVRNAASEFREQQAKLCGVIEDVAN